MGALDTAIDGALDPLDGAIDGVVGDKRKANVYNAVQQNPDEFAQATQLSRSTGLPAPVVARNLPQVKQRADLDALDKVLDQSPAVRKAMDDPTFAILARDDTETLAEIERTADRRAGGVIGGPAYQRPDEMKASQGPEASFASVVSGMFKALPQGGEQTRQGLRMQFADVIGSPEMSLDAMRRYQRAQTEGVVSAPQFDSLTAAGLYSGGVSLVQQVPGLAASILTGNPLLGLAGIGVQTEATAYGKYRSRGATPGQALVGGVGEGAVEVATEMLPMSFLVNRFGKAGAGEFLAGLLAREIPSEQIATLVQDAIDTAVANPDKTWAQYLAERPEAAYQTLVATVAQAGAMGAISTVAQRVAAPTMQAEAAGREAETLAQLSQLAAASKLRERDPQTFEQYVETAAPGQEVYLDARTLQQSGVDLAALAQASPAVAAQLTEALATGGDIVLPVSEYAARLAGTNLDTALLPHLRASEDALSQDEAQRFYQGQAEEFKKAAARVMEDKAADDTWQASAKAVEAQLLDQLQQTNRFTPDVNSAYAALMRDFYVATAARTGTTPEAMFAQYPLKVAAQAVRGGQVLSQGERIVGAAFKEIKTGRVISTGNIHLRNELPDDWDVRNDVSGFVTNTGRFLDRGEAASFVGLKSNDRLMSENLGSGDPKYAPKEVVSGEKANPISKLFQSVTNLLKGGDPSGKEGQGRRQEVLTDGGAAPLDMGQFFQGQKAVDRTDTPEFKRWSEDAPVISSEEARVHGFETGAPVVVEAFHGTTKGGFAEFNTEGGSGKTFGTGAFFADNAAGASTYSGSRTETQVSTDPDFDPGYDGEPGNYHVYLKMSNPLVIDAEGRNWDNIGAEEEWFARNEDGDIVEYFTNEADANFFRDTADEPIDIEKSLNPDTGMSTDDFVRQAREEGYDSVIFQNVTDEGRYGQGYGWANHTYVVFEPTQIKSATQNRGTFDPNDPNILAQSNRAEISFGADITQQPSVITLFNNADLSSFLHEMGHFQLEVLAHLASQPNAPAEIVQDMDAVLKWFGITGASSVEGGDTSGSLGQGPVDSEAFKRWFGDSKVVDAEGKPLVVYHGTRRGGFSEFSINASSRSEGFVFTSNREMALTYSGQDNSAEPGPTSTKAGLYSAYISIKNPKVVDWAGEYFQKRDGTRTNDEIAKAKAEGHDGLIIRNINDPGGFALAMQNKGIVADGPDVSGDVYVAFRPEQIKSAIGNRGTFDPNDPNILNQGGDEGTRGPLPQRRTALEVWNAMSLEEKRPYHEQFARGFESYLFEGKAPSQELVGIFQRFRAWLISVYKSIKALNVEISDDIRGVFDRLVATDEAIKAAEAARAYTPLFPDDPEAQALAAKATQDATDELQRRSLRDMRWLDNARGRILKQMQADAKAKRKAVEAEVRAEVRAQPIYAARAALKEGTKLSIEGLEDLYAGDGDRYALLDWKPLVDQRLAGKEGMHPDQAAEAFGFTSGDQLVKALLSAEPEASAVEGITDQRVLERYGDISSPDTLARAVDEAIHNEARARFVATELKALNKAAGPVRAISKAAKDFAEATVARKKVREIKPARHAAAETRAAKAAEKALAAGDTVLAADEKRNQLIQNYATRASYDALTEIDKALRYFAKLDGESTRKNLDTEYLDQIDALLERFDFRKSITNKDAKKRTTLLEWVQGQRDEGFEPDIPPELLAEAMRKPYKEMTLEELRGLIDTVKQIEHLGRLKRKLLTAKDEREFKAIRDEVAASIVEHAKGVRDLRTRNLTSDALKDAGARFLAMHRKMASVAREMDGFKDGGPMWEYLIRSMNDAGNRESGMRADATARLHALVKPLLASGKMGGKGIYFESLGGSFNREERIAIALNLGNAGNTQRLLDGEGWTMARLRPLLDTITPEEADFVQSVWDFFESYRPEIAAKERRIYGKEPAWVEPVPLMLGGKELKGGYYPVKYDRARSERAAAHEDAESAKAQMKGAYTSATTRRSFTKTRAEEVTGRPLLYSFAGIYQGTNEVIHDLSWHEWLIDANRLVRSLSGVISTHYGDETRDLFKKAIEDIAAGDVPAQNVFERGINHLRMGATVAGLGWNFSTALLQPFGLTQSMVRIGPAWVVKGLSQWIKSPIDTGNDVRERSAFMRDRARTMQREINEIQNQVRGSKLDPVRATFFLMIQKMQMVADMPTWLGAYEKAIAEGNAEDRAVALADQAVTDAQGGGQTKDLAQIQRGGPLLKLWTNFYSFFNTTYNLAVEKTKEKGGNPKLYPSLAMDYLLLFVIPCAMVTLVKAVLQGDADDEDELVKKMAADQISYLLGTMVGLRELSAAMQKLAGVEQFKSSYGGPAGLRMFQEVDKLSTQMAQGDVDAALLKAINNTAGNLLHYPSGQINRTAGGVAAMIEGKTDNPMAVLLGPPPKK